MLVRPANNSGSALQNLYVILSLLVGVGLGILVVRVPDSLQLIVIVVGVFAFAAAIYRVHWGLILLIIITYLNLSDIAIEYYGAPSITKLFSVLLLFGFILRWLIYGEKPKNWGLYTVLLGAYGIVALISLFFAADQLVAQAALLDFVKDAVLSIMIVLLLKERVDLRRIVWALLLCGIIMGTLSIVQYVTGSYDNEFGGFAKTPDVRTIVGSSIVENRATGPLGDPNVYAQVLLVIVPIALDRAWNTKSRRLRFFALWALFATSGAVILTFSRGAFISLMVMIIAMLIYLRPKPMALMVTLASGILLLQFVPAQYTQRMESLFSFLPWADSGTSSDSSFRGRTSEMIVGYMMFRDNPIAGVGLDNYSVLYQSYSRQIGLDPRLQARDAHNLYLEVGAETGLLGLGVFSVLLVSMARGVIRGWNIFKEKNDQEYAGLVLAIGIGLLGYFTASLFIHAAYARYLWLLIGLGYALQFVAKEAPPIGANPWSQT